MIPWRDSELRPDLTEGSTSKSSKKKEETAKCGKSIVLQAEIKYRGILCPFLRPCRNVSLARRKELPRIRFPDGHWASRSMSRRCRCHTQLTSAKFWDFGPLTSCALSAHNPRNLPSFNQNLSKPPSPSLLTSFVGGPLVRSAKSEVKFNPIRGRPAGDPRKKSRAGILLRHCLLRQSALDLS